MNKEIIISKICTGECSDATFNYDLQLKPDTTLSEFVDGIISDTTEWGCITLPELELFDAVENKEE